MPLAIDDRQDFARVAEHGAQPLEVAARQRGRAVTVHVVGVEREEAPRVGIGLAGEPSPDRLAHHRPLLAGDREHVGLDVGQDLLAVGDVEVAAWPIVAERLAVAQFDVLDAEVASEGLGGVDETLRRLGIVGGRAAVDRERERRQRVAKEPALHLRERQDADEVGTTLGDEVVSAVAELVLEDLAPADAVEERRRRAALDERLPARGILHPVLAHREVAGRRRGHRDRLGLHGRAPSRNTASARSQRKSFSSLARRALVRSRFT